MTRAEFIERLKKLIEEAENDERTAESSQNVQNDDLISRKAAIDAICTEGTRLERNGTVAMAEIKQWCVDILDALPSAQPEQKKGKWKPISDGFVDIYECDQCGNIEEYERNYCTQCGADMRGEQDETL